MSYSRQLSALVIVIQTFADSFFFLFFLLTGTNIERSKKKYIYMHTTVLSKIIGEEKQKKKVLEGQYCEKVNNNNSRRDEQYVFAFSFLSHNEIIDSIDF